MMPELPFQPRNSMDSTDQRRRASLALDRGVENTEQGKAEKNVQVDGLHR
jgi:hypothetical protein